MPCVPVSGAETPALSRQRLPSLATHPFLLPVDHPPAEEEAPQRAHSDTKQRRLVLGGWTAPGKSLRKASLGDGRRPHPWGPWGAHRAPLGGVLANVRAMRCALRGGVAPGCQSRARVRTHRCTSDRLSGGRTSGGSHTWGPCPCPHSCAGSLRFHSYRLLVRPKVYVRVYKRNNNKED